MANGVVRVEKKRTNLIGLIIVFAVLIGAFCFGLYYYIQNPQKVRAIFKKDEVYINEKTDSQGNVVVGNNSLQPVKFDMKQVYYSRDYGYDVYVESVETANNGYTVNMLIKTSGRLYPTKMTILDVLVDGYSTGITFDIKLEEEESEYKVDFFIKKTTLAELEITRFSKLSFYFYCEIDGREFKIDRAFKSVDSFSYEKVDNRKSGLINLGKKDGLTIYFYKILQDKEFYYLYFLAKGDNHKHNHYIQLKKLIINDEIYNYEAEFETFARESAMKQFYLKIPRKDFEKINNFNVQFFLITDDEKDEEKNIYITNSFRVNI